MIGKARRQRRTFLIYAALHLLILLVGLWVNHGWYGWGLIPVVCGGYMLWCALRVHRALKEIMANPLVYLLLMQEELGSDDLNKGGVLS